MIDERTIELVSQESFVDDPIEIHGIKYETNTATKDWVKMSLVPENISFYLKKSDLRLFIEYSMQ